ncbi:MAG: (E)-4-hydroxy-3-methylbut-2-enyl-diphosphate synthase [Bacteroidaceae bacterium]|nr:(E)-4-hydroxy-3-methylbut-2-enyl-diphosphate synthase [Bacteroidaceae bacterium]
MLRRYTNEVMIGNLPLGGENPIRVQSMTTLPTTDTQGCIDQIKRIVDAGGEYVRLTTQGEREALNLKNIKSGLLRDGYDVPLIADVHFNARVADIAALYADKVRINPGNYIDPARKFLHLEYTDEEYTSELKRLEDRFVALLNICKAHHTAIRIGVNHGSLSDRIMSRYGDTPAGIVESCMEFLRVCVKHNFKDVVVSIKASNTIVMVESVRRLVREMDKSDMHFPLHLGVTEAGEGEDGRLKSAVGIGTLLLDGIGDTIRVSLSEAPEKEIPVAYGILQATHARITHTEFISCPGCGRTLYNLQDTIQQIKHTFAEVTDPQLRSHLAHLKIAIMGCIVNGPGEMADADYGYVGAAAGKISLYKGKECVEKNIPQSQAVEKLIELIKKYATPG